MFWLPRPYTYVMYGIRQCNRFFPAPRLVHSLLKYFFQISVVILNGVWPVGAGGMIWGKALVQVGYFQSVYNILTFSFLVGNDLY